MSQDKSGDRRAILDKLNKRNRLKREQLRRELRRDFIRSRRTNKRGMLPRRNSGTRINSQIQAPEVRVIDDKGEKLGIVSSREALIMAEDRGLDLVEVAPNAKPPTCKIMNYGKWKYENDKKEAAARKRQTVISVKEVQVRPQTEAHDLNTKIRKAREFLLRGDKVKLNLRFRGRELAHQEVGFQRLMDMAAELDDVSVIEQEPKKEGLYMHCLLASDPAKLKEFSKVQKSSAPSGKTDATNSVDSSIDNSVDRSVDKKSASE